MSYADLSKYNFSELKELQQNVERELFGRGQEEVKKARDQILSIAQNVGLPLEQLIAIDGKPSKTRKLSTVRPQYRNPADGAQTWSGRGRQPRWVADAITKGKTLEEMRIQ